MRIHEYGGPQVLTWESVEVPEPAAGEARIRHTAVGLNLIDTYHRSGLYPLELPSGIGSEAAGVVEAVGEGVTEVSVGDRVVYTGMPIGAYAGHRNFAADRLVPIPEGVPDEVAAAERALGLVFRDAVPPANDAVVSNVMAALRPVRTRRRIVAFLPVAASVTVALLGAGAGDLAGKSRRVGSAFVCHRLRGG